MRLCNSPLASPHLPRHKEETQIPLPSVPSPFPGRKHPNYPSQGAGEGQGTAPAPLLLAGTSTGGAAWGRGPGQGWRSARASEPPVEIPCSLAQRPARLPAPLSIPSPCPQNAGLAGAAPSWGRWILPGTPAPSPKPQPEALGTAASSGVQAGLGLATALSAQGQGRQGRQGRQDLLLQWGGQRQAQ